jgi:tetratricopeptide (TPR) repeat protein
VSLLSSSIGALNNNNANAVLAHVEKAALWLVYRQQWVALTQLLNALDKSKANLPADKKAQFAVFRAQNALHNGQRAQAKDWLQKAVSQNPSMGDALLSLADIYSQEQQPEQAILYFQRAAAFDDYRERALLGQAQLEINRQAYEPALKLLREAVRHNPTRSDLAENIRGLEKLARSQQAQ